MLEEYAEPIPDQAGVLAMSVPPVPPQTTCGEVYERLNKQADESAVAVVDADGRPLGLVNRFNLLVRYSQRFVPELYSRRPIASLMNDEPLVVDEATPIHELGRRVALDRPQALVDGYIITSGDRYRGIGTGEALIRAKVARDAHHTSQLRAALVEAARARKATSEFLAMFSHELRTPLNAIIGFSELIQNQRFGPIGQTCYADYAADINRAGEHLLSLITSILDLSRAEAGHLKLRSEPVDVLTVMETCLRLVRERGEFGGLSIRVRATPDLPPLEADSLKVKQMLLNLLSNAIKFTPNGGEITVIAGLIDGEIVLRVRDTGIGIAATDIPRALEPFGQIDSKLARKNNGAGIGLPLVQALIKAHDGRLEIDSTPGQGTTVSLHFPKARTLLLPSALARLPVPTGWVS